MKRQALFRRSLRAPVDDHQRSTELPGTVGTGRSPRSPERVADHLASSHAEPASAWATRSAWSGIE